LILQQETLEYLNLIFSTCVAKLLEIPFAFPEIVLCSDSRKEQQKIVDTPLLCYYLGQFPVPSEAGFGRAGYNARPMKFQNLSLNQYSNFIPEDHAQAQSSGHAENCGKRERGEKEKKKERKKKQGTGHGPTGPTLIQPPANESVGSF
jgi:hypothetical protein